MLKKLGILSAVCFALAGCFAVDDNEAVYVPDVALQQPTIKMPSSIIVCRARQCAPAKAAMSKEYIYNTLLHMLDSNARKRAIVCEADPRDHTCTEEYVSMPITVGITPAYLYIDDVKITDVSISRKNTSALDLILNWNISYNGQTPVCRPSKTLLYAKNVNNVIMEDNGYACKMTTIGTSVVKTLFAIDYIDLDYNYIGGFYSIGLSGPAFGGGSGYMMLRLPEDISTPPSDFIVPQKAKKNSESDEQLKEANNDTTKTEVTAVEKTVVNTANPLVATQTTAAGVNVAIPQGQYVQEVTYQEIPTPQAVEVVKEPAPNVDTIIKYNHPAQSYDKAKAELAKKRKEESEAVTYEGVKVFPVQHYKKKENTTPPDKNSLTDYRKYGK